MSGHLQCPRHGRVTDGAHHYGLSGGLRQRLGRYLIRHPRGRQKRRLSPGRWLLCVVDIVRPMFVVMMCENEMRVAVSWGWWVRRLLVRVISGSHERCRCYCHCRCRQSAVPGSGLVHRIAFGPKKI